MKKKLTDESFDMLFIDSPLYQLTPTTFALEIEKLVKYDRMDYLDAVVTLCEKFDIEFETIPKLLSKTMKERIEVSASKRKLMKL